MIKLIGAAIIILATTWAGFEAAKHLALRPKQLRQIKLALQSLEAEIMYGQTPLQDAARKLSKLVPMPLSLFFESFSSLLSSGNTTVKQAWEESLERVWGLMALKQGEFEILVQFGETLGRHDRHHQQKQILLTLTHLEREEAEAIDRQLKYEKMMKSLGFLSGLLLTLLLL
ncbi:stage III sporulation protein SpoAB [Peribacillus psychrosaccharolyticus]|uniref:Stage III sporulation protein SpoAB n=1 Tax=Peribacillus psychrosaccharolyticus TaxID=1407 RepID=A0A974NLT4_PERPY|nr:stage III sporulation protein SpoIIIAB [Peribacillus psychrosaccharolyticus]MEC2056880.1 stage III sporulation protein SpoIIIAB [Peribacillus psychrosaccharolyticus]MED3746462.1 stage III sporulation protein SpoIIIAB [Peribacillus psychrosaccharolyticus]QQS99999.1 stage III sporulation protein SpoAB [Peribacillus psychrosaccharolyticus]